MIVKMLSARRADVRILFLALILLACMLFLPAKVMAEEYPGSAFISLSNDGKFVVSDGARSGVTIAHLEVPLQDVADVKLEDWNLEKYSYTDYNTGEPDPNAPTVLKLYLYLLENYYGSAGNGNALVTSGDPHSFFMNTFWGHDCNLLYYVNGQYPLFKPGWGATADGIILEEGDFVDVAMFTDWGFYLDSAAGFNYFVRAGSDPVDGEITFAYKAVAGEPLTVQAVRGMGNVSEGKDTAYSAADDLALHYGPAVDVDDVSRITLQEGKADIVFEKPGEYYVWIDGGIGPDTGEVVSSPNVAKVTVTGPVKPEGEDPKPAKEPAKSVRTVTLDGKTISAGMVDNAVKAAGGSAQTVTTFIIGKKVKKISKGAFSKYGNVTVLEVQSKKLKKKSVKGSLKGSAVTTVKVSVGSKKVNKKYVKKYKKIFTKKNAGRKVTVR